MMDYDVIVIGGGSAGSLIAGRLALETDAHVLLLEAGGPDSNPLIHIPSGYSKLLAGGHFLYPYETVPQAQLDGKPRALQQGKGLGGSSSINAMAYVRGQARDYDAWEQATGDSGWGWSAMLREFTSMEGNDLFAGPLHGTNGPLRVSQPSDINALNLATIQAYQEVGLPFNADYNGASQRGVGPTQLTIGDAKRCSAATAFLDPAKSRRNLKIVTHATATRVLVEGDHAVGVEYRHSDVLHEARGREIVLAAGALNSPRLLMLSGIGPGDQLAAHGIPVRIDAPEVGGNLQDHPQVSLSARARSKLGYASTARGLPMMLAGVRYLITHDGPAASSGIESVCYFNPDDAEGDPTIQCFHLPVLVKAGLGEPERDPGLTLENVVLQPRSRGSLKLRDADPGSAPLIDPNYLGEAEDMRSMVAGLRYSRRALRAVLEDELSPGADVETDEALERHARDTVVGMWHPVGTCRMGNEDTAVVDPTLRVRGVAGLWVIDASVMPNIVSANTNAPTMAVASRGVGFLKASLTG